MRQSGQQGREGYRADIDGLRAVAVGLVILNHLGISSFSGGFIGVDIFFVISGFLITGILKRQMESGGFSFASFYKRRALRILPAVYVMLLAVFAVGYFVMLPGDYSDLAEAGGSVLVFASNLYFWKSTGGYFAANSAELPLLHIWSLSLEEQFYFLWPIALLALIRIKSARSRIVMVAVAAVLSFAYAEWSARSGSTGAYYFLHARAGELLMGALLALLPSNGPARPARTWASTVMAGLGVALIAAPAVLLSGASVFPGVNALVPCLGAALLIIAPRFGANPVTWLLSMRPVVFIGLISYSLYLYHWPVISFLHYQKVELTPWVNVMVVASTLLLATLSWALVENTFRYAHGPRRTGKLALGLAIGLGAVAAPAVIFARQGIPSRVPYETLTQDQLDRERSRYWTLVGTTKTEFAPGERNLMVIGNSHAYDLSYALTGNGFSGNVRLIATGGECFNFGHNPVNAEAEPICAKAEHDMLADPQLGNASVIYLHDSWAGVDVVGFRNVVEAIRSKSAAPIYIFGPKMMFTESALGIRRAAAATGKVTPSDVNAFAQAYSRPDRARLDHDLGNVVASWQMPGVTYVSFITSQCATPDSCALLSPEGAYFYFDNNHFTLQGSRDFGSRLKVNHPDLF